MPALDIIIPLQALPNALPGTAQYTFSTSNTNAKLDIRGLVIVNTSGATRTFTIHHVASGGSATSSNARFDTIAIAAKTTYEIGYEDGEWTLRAGDAIFAFADDTTVNIAVTGNSYE